MSCRCPIHNGDNPSAFCLYFNEGNPKWFCYTHNCHEKYQNTLSSLVSLLKIPQINQDIQINIPVKRKYNIKKISMSSQEYHQIFGFDSEYAKKRGFSQQIIDDFGIVDCKNQHHIMYNRSVFPVYDMLGTTIIGWSGRSLFNKCLKCSNYHDGQCHFSPKWRHNKGLGTSKLIYNFWNLNKIKSVQKTIILCEGILDVLALEQNQIYGALALFGAKISDMQQILLESINIRRIILLMDKDEAGIKASTKISAKLHKHEVVLPAIQSKDIGEMNKDDIEMIRQLI